MTDKFNMADLTASLLAGDAPRLPAPGKPQAGQQEAGAPAAAPVVSGAPERRRPELWRTTQTPEGFRPTPRQRQRDARAYAESWYAALRAWETRSNGQLVPRDLTPRSSKTRLMQPVVGNWGAGDVLLRHTEVNTPMGWVSEAALSRLCNDDELLGRVRGGQGPASLLRTNRTWIHPVERAQAYGAAVLRLAGALGDPRAGVLGHALTS